MPRQKPSYFVELPFIVQFASDPMLSDLFPIMSGYSERRFDWFASKDRVVTDWILLYTVGGAGELKYRRRTHLLRPGDVIIIPGNTPHLYRSAGESPWHCHWIHFDGKAAQTFLRKIKLLPREDNPVTHIGIHLPLKELFDELRLHTLPDHPGLQHTHFAMLLRYLLTKIAVYKESADTDSKSRLNIEQIRMLMRDNLQCGVTIPEIARKVGMSTPNFYRCFTEQTGMAPAKFMTLLKIALACERLDTSQDTLEHIAGDLGFSSAYHLSNCFKKHVGIPPSKYRNLSARRPA